MSLADLANIALIRDLDYQEPTPTGRRRFSAPFNGDSEAYVHEQQFIQDATRFRSAELSTPDLPDYPASLLVEEGPLEPVASGLVQWTRVYSRIPAKRIEGESYAWQMPGIAIEAVYNALTVNNDDSLNVSGARTRIRTNSVHSLSVGNIVQIVFTAAFGDIEQTFTIARTVRAIISLDSFEVDIVLEHDDPFYASVTRVDGGRDPVTKAVHSLLQFDYFCPGIPGQVKTFQDIPIIQAMTIRDAFGKETNTFSTGTNPRKEDYINDIADHKLIVPESSVVRRWRGNIFERVTRFVYAQ